MKLMSMVGLSVVVATSVSMTAFAQDTKPVKQGKEGQKSGKNMMMERFNKADADKDGKLSLVEFKTMEKGDADAKFLAADTDKDGFLTSEELKAARRMRRPVKADAAKAVVPVPAAPVPASATPAE